MRNVLIAGAIALVAIGLGGCDLTSTLSAVGTDLGIIAADLPTACGNLSAELTAADQSGLLPSNVSTAVQKGVTNYSKYCGPAAAAAADAQAAIAAIQTTIGAIQAAQAAPSN